MANSNPVGFSYFKDFMQKIWASLGLIVKYILIFRDIFVPLCAFVLFLHSFSLITRTIKTDMPFHILSYSLKIHSTLELIVITKSSQNGVDLQRYLSFQSFLWIFWRGIRTFLHKTSTRCVAIVFLRIIYKHSSHRSQDDSWFSVFEQSSLFSTFSFFIVSLFSAFGERERKCSW